MQHPSEHSCLNASLARGDKSCNRPLFAMAHGLTEKAFDQCRDQCVTPTSAQNPYHKLA